jgi:integrase/recombinase XerD
MTREAYALDLRQFAAWCHYHGLRMFGVRRADIECFGRDLEDAGRARVTVTRRLSTIAGFYRYAVEEELLEHSPAVHVRRPRLDYESHTTGLDRNEVGALLVAAGLGAPEALGSERGHHTLAVIRKGGKKAVIPLAPRTARAIDLATGERCAGPTPSTRASRADPRTTMRYDRARVSLDRHATCRVSAYIAGAAR